ncbi:hypothetical protein SLS60_007387 [Paraconiothyrium brasiliense]|uniref:F-box domain-containing protein n=1 Tax=Paraconiothyrium brasiliense TaxID=300254 RepID=A0ABR3R572_9PLEO
MAHTNPSRSTAFNTLPIELNKWIAHQLDDHKDIASFKAVCRATCYAIDGDHFSFWRAKFCEDFARPPGKTNQELRDEYMKRWKWLRRFVNLKKSPMYQFVRGRTFAEKEIVEVLTALIKESFASSVQSDDGSRPHCLNMVRLKEFVLESSILLGGRRPPQPMLGEPGEVHPNLAAVKLMLSHFLFDEEVPTRSWFAIDDAQKAVYSATNIERLFEGRWKNLLNWPWFLHCMNFFRQYMTTAEASGLHAMIQGLRPSQKPVPWDGPLKRGSAPLPTRWIGTYALMTREMLTRFRTKNSLGRHHHIYYDDLNVDEGNTQTLNLEFLTEEQQNKLTWPEMFESRLHARRDLDPDAAKARAQHREKYPYDTSEDAPSIRFDGWGEEGDLDYFATGWLNPLPDQCGIPGFQRVTFMKHPYEDLNNVHQDGLWAYEGVVLPGGKIMIGRWWEATSDNINYNDDYSGPFIFWAVDPSDEDEEEELDKPAYDEEWDDE